MIAVIDYGAGNIRSVEKALIHIGCKVTVTRDPQVLLAADAAVLPGVGSFGDAMQALRARGLESRSAPLSLRAGRFSASASACRFCLKAARNRRALRAQPAARQDRRIPAGEG